jgi:hypothetical protein
LASFSSTSLIDISKHEGHRQSLLAVRRALRVGRARLMRRAQDAAPAHEQGRHVEE